MDLKELIEYYDENIINISTEDIHYNTILLMRSKIGIGKIKNEPHIEAKYYWLNDKNFNDTSIYNFFFCKNIDALKINFNGNIKFSAHIGVIIALKRENFYIDKIGVIF